MQLVFGSYPFDFNGAEVTGSQEIVWNQGGQPLSQRRTVRARGYKAVNGQVDAALQESALRTALSVPFQDLHFYQDNAADTPLSLFNIDPVLGASITGVRVKSLSFNQANGPEYVTIRSFEAEFEAEYPFLTSTNFWTYFTETLSFEGGLPIVRHRLAIEGPNSKQLVYPQDTYRATQSGQGAIYRRQALITDVPAPKWPFSLREGPKINFAAPRRVGPAGYQDYGVTWHYDFEDVDPLIGFPSLWPI